MEMANSSSRSPDSSSGDYLYYAFCERRERPRLLDLPFSFSMADSTYEDFQNQVFERDNSSNSQVQRDLSRGEEQNERSVINSTIGRNDVEDIFGTIPVSVESTPAVGSYQSRSSVASNSGGLSSTTNENSSTSTENLIHDIFNSDIETMPINPSYAQPRLSYFSSTSNKRLPTFQKLSASTAATSTFPKTEQSHISSSTSNDSNNSSIFSLNTNLANNTRQQKTIIYTNQINRQPTVMPATTSHNSLSKMPLPSYNLNAQKPERSAKHSHEERGIKRKSSSISNDPDYLSSAPSSSLNYINREQNTQTKYNWRKKVPGISSQPKVQDVDDDIQIILPETSHSSSASSSSADSSRLHSNISQPALSQPDPIQISTPTISEVPSSDEINQFIDVIYTLGEEPLYDIIPVDVETREIPHASENEDSSSSSIVSIHEVQEIPNNIASVITIDDSPKNDELLEIKIKQEAENVKEDFKKLLEDELICNICTELLIKPITLGCSHTFCKFCISEWKDKKNQCPMCRAEVVTETPCLFLDNFISKAVERLDPASVEKRLEIIKTREELLKNKVRKPPIPLCRALNIHPVPHQALNLPIYMPFPTHSNLQAPTTNVHHPSNILSQSLINQSLSILPVSMPFRAHRSSTISQRPPHQSSSLYNEISRIFESVPQPSSSIPQPSSSFHQQPSSVSQQSANIPQLSSNLLQQPSNLLQQPSNLLQQPSNPHVPMNTYFFY